MAATDKVSGIDGACVHDGNTITITAWSVDITSETKDVTDSSNSGWMEKLPSGIVGWSGSFEGYLVDGTNDTSLTPIGAAAATLTLTAESGLTFGGSAILTNRNVALTIGPGDATKNAYTLEGTGALTETNA